jgi:hypothetical protein
MPYEFPDAPAIGDHYQQYTWDGEKWTTKSAAGGGASVTMQDDPPDAPNSGDLWWKSDTGAMYVAFDDGTSVQWVLATTAGGGFVSKSGDTMSGSLTITPATGAAMTLNKATDLTANSFNGWMNGKARWALQLGAGGVAEAGADVGSDFQVYRYGDGGALIDMPFGISRATGVATFLKQLNVNSIVGSGQLQSKNSLAINIPNVPATAPIYGLVAGKKRWGLFFGNGEAESGGNAGSNFQLNAYTDTGAAGPIPVQIYRSSGLVKLNAGLNIAGGTLNITQGGQSALMTGYIAASGYQGKGGQSGAYSGYIMNTDWNSANVIAWVGTVNVGALAFASDYRIKQDVAPLDSMWERTKALKPIRYRLKDYTPPEAVPDQGEVEARPLVISDEVERWGFIAHELQETLTASAATGTKDEANIIQSPNPWTIIAALTKTVQEMQARIEALEAR